MPIRRCAVVVMCGAALTACGGSDAAGPTTTAPVTITTTATAVTGPTTGVDTVASTAERIAESTVAVEVTVPDGVLAAVITQARDDPALQQYQIRLKNGSDERLSLARLRFAWEGFTSAWTDRTTIVVSGQTVDIPVPLPRADCRGDGLIDAMPSLDGAIVEVELADGSTRSVPAVDVDGVARRLYLDDCERQFVDAQVAIEWTDLREEGFEGRPVSRVELRLTRRDGSGTVSVRSVSDTVPYAVRPVDDPNGGPIVTLPAGRTSAEAPIRIIESRCDPHALGETKQPHQFVAQIDLGDGVSHPYVVMPDPSWFAPMRQTADRACARLGKNESLDG